MKRLFAAVFAVFLLSCLAYASSPPDVLPPSVDVVASADSQPPADDGTAPTDPQPSSEDGTTPADPQPPAEDGTAPADPQPPFEDGTTPVDPLPPVKDGTAPTMYSDPKVTYLLGEVLNRIDFVLFVCVPILVSIVIILLFCFWFYKVFIQ